MQKNYGAGYAIASIIRFVGWIGIALSALSVLLSVISWINASGNTYNQMVLTIFSVAAMFNSLLIVGVGYVMDAVFDGASNTYRMVGMPERAANSIQPLERPYPEKNSTTKVAHPDEKSALSKLVKGNPIGDWSPKSKKMQRQCNECGVMIENNQTYARGLCIDCHSKSL